MRHTIASSSPVSALDAVVEREKSIREVPLDDVVSVAIDASCRRIAIEVGGKVFRGNLDGKLVHQLGSKIWPGLDLENTWKAWREARTLELALALRKALSSSSSILKYREEDAGLVIYGVTSSNFRNMNQLFFRSVLVNELAKLGISSSHEVFKTKFNEVGEHFIMPSTEAPVGLKCSVIYGLNNGYSSYRIRWGRTVLICSNGLTAFKIVGKDRWIHSAQVDIRDFAARSVESAYNHISALEGRLIAAQSRPLDADLVNDLLSRLSLARATHRRVISRLEKETAATGNNEWSLSQTFTFLATHETAIPPRVRARLTQAGTEILEGTLEGCLN